MDLKELSGLFAGAFDAKDIFGEDTEAKYIELAQVCHPDKYTDPAEKAEAERLFKELQTWKSKVGVAHTIGKYEIGQLVAAGDCSDVFIGRNAAGKLFVVKISRSEDANVFVRDEYTRLTNLLKECKNHLAYFPTPVETFSVRDTKTGVKTIAVYEHVDGLYTAEQIHEKYPDGLDGRHIAWMFNRVLEVMGEYHQYGVINGGVVPCHLYYQVDSHGLKLGGWLHSAMAGQRLRMVSARYKDWYPPEVISPSMKNEKVRTSTDIYLAVKSMIYLAGGDVSTKKMPDTIPVQMQRFFHGCLLESPMARPHNAWELQDEFKDMLKSVYGPSKFVSLAM